MADRPWLSGGRGTFATFKKQTHDDARAVMREIAARVEQVTRETREIEHAQVSKERYWQERDARQKAFFSRNPSATHSDFAKEEKPFSDAAKKGMSVTGRQLERTIGREERQESAQPLQVGVRGGRFYVSSTGEKVYVGNNEHHDAAQTRGKGPWQR